MDEEPFVINKAFSAYILIIKNSKNYLTSLCLKI